MMFHLAYCEVQLMDFTFTSASCTRSLAENVGYDLNMR